MSRLKLYPIKFKPIYKELIWGGTKLHEFFSKDIPTDRKIGESWELADLPNDKSTIANGELTGQTLGWAVDKFPLEIMGNENFRGPFPLLIKFIDAEEMLSVQVHPDEKACHKLGSGTAKTECWYIVDAAEGSIIYKGLKKGVTKEIFERAIYDGTVAELLVKITVKRGECYFLPGGTVHSIGGGLLIAEIQAPSDTTYRIFDWNRVDTTDKPRQLHIREATASINFDNTTADLEATTNGCLVNCKYFKVYKKQHKKDSSISVPSGQMKALVIIKGQGAIKSGKMIPVEFAAGETILIPAAYEGVMQFSPETEYLKVTI